MEAAGPMNRRPVVAVLAGLSISLVAVVLLLPYGGQEQPGLSYDTPYYVWRTRAVAADGLDVLTSIPTGAVPERPGVPVLGAMLGALTGTGALTFSVIVRAVAAVAIGLAAGAMAVEALREPRWAFAAFVVGVGASAAVVGTAVGSLDQLLADVLLVATAATAPLAAAGRRGVAAAALLFAAAAATHWVFAALFLLLLMGVVGALLPGSLTARRSGRAWSRTPSVLLLRLLLVASAASIVTLALLPALPDHLPPAVSERNVLRLAAYELPLVVPLAALGFVLTIRRAERSRRTTIILLGSWAVIVPVAIAISAVLPTPIKLFRVAPFALGVPALVTLAWVTVASRVGSRLGRGGPVLGTLLLAGGLIWASGSPASSFGDAAGASVAERVMQARIAGRYLEEIPRRGRSVIFVTGRSARLLDRVVRSAVPPDLIPDTWVFLGRPSDLAAGGPVTDPDRPRLSEESQRWWASAWPAPGEVLGRDPIVIQIATPTTTIRGATKLGRGVAVVRGPEPSPSFRPPPPFEAGWLDLLTATGLALVALSVAGGGWVRALLDVSGLAAFGLSPAFGVAVLVLAGTAVGRFGLPLGRPEGIVVVLVTAAIGWISSLWVRRHPRAEEAQAEKGHL
jgi:hypothetical protein